MYNNGSLWTSNPSRGLATHPSDRGASKAGERGEMVQLRGLRDQPHPSARRNMPVRFNVISSTT